MGSSLFAPFASLVPGIANAWQNQKPRGVGRGVAGWSGLRDDSAHPQLIAQNFAKKMPMVWDTAIPGFPPRVGGRPPRDQPKGYPKVEWEACR